MKKLLFCSILGASAQIAHAQNTTLRHDYVSSERYVYLNTNLIGYFPVCIDNASNEFYFSDDFFEQVSLIKSSMTTQCRGHQYTKPQVPFVRNDAAGTLSATTTSTDFSALASNPFSAATAEKDRAAREKNVVIQASALQHAFGFTHDAAGATNFTLNAAAQYYTDAGMFTVEGVAASEAGQTQSYLRDINWKRHFADSGTNASFGLSSISAPGSAIRLYGFVLGSDEDTLNNNTTQSIDGFAEVFGKIQIRSRGILLKEVPVSVGNFSISTVGLPASAGAAGQYNLTLVDDSGRTVRSWDVFLPIGARLLRPGRSNWSVYTGQIENSLNNSSMLGGPQNLGAGFTYTYGINDWLTADSFSVLSSHTKGLGAALTAAPTSWMSFSAGQASYPGPAQTGSTSYGGIDLHSEYIGVTSNVSKLSCTTHYGDANSVVVGQCTNIYSNLYASAGRFGRFSVQHMQSNGAAAHSSSNSFSWTPPSFGPISLSIYGNRFTDSSSPTVSSTYGFTMSIPFGRGQIQNSANYTSPNSKNVSSSYQESIDNELQYILTADVGVSSSSSVRSMVQYNPWYGTYQANAQVGQNGQQSIGMNESGALVFARQQVLLSKESAQGYAVVHLDKLSDLALENGSGQRQTVLNQRGYAVIPVSHGSELDMRISPEELPDNISIGSNLVGHISDNWQATLWEPPVRRVNKGWAKLVFSPGNPVPLGAALHLNPNHEPTYVLESGDIYFDDFPANAKHVEVLLPGNTNRCFVDFSADIKLKQAYLPGKPEFTCRIPL